jgi:hypothetical protein
LGGGQTETEVQRRQTDGERHLKNRKENLDPCMTEESKALTLSSTCTDIHKRSAAQ